MALIAGRSHNVHANGLYASADFRRLTLSWRLDLFTDATGWLRSSLRGRSVPKDEGSDMDGRVRRVPEAEMRAAEIQAILQRSYPAIRWTVTFEVQPRALVSGLLDNYVIVKGLRRDGSSVPSVRIHWRDAASTPAAKLVQQIKRGLKLGS